MHTAAGSPVWLKFVWSSFAACFRYRFHWPAVEVSCCWVGCYEYSCVLLDTHGGENASTNSGETEKKEIVAEGREAAERTGGAREGQGGPNGVPGWHPRPDTRGR